LIKRFIVLLLCLSLSGCGIIDYMFLKPRPKTPLELLEAGKDAMEAKDYKSAAKYFEKLKDKFPFSPYTKEGEFLLGESLFYAKKYAEAVDAYKEFESLHPGDRRIPFVLFRIGVADYRQRHTVDLPQQEVEEAIQYFTRLIQGYPNSPYIARAQQYIRKCRLILAQHELYVANFYWRTRRYLAAWMRYRYIISHFPDFPSIVKYCKAMEKFAFIRYEISRAERERKKLQGGWWEKFLNWL